MAPSTKAETLADGLRRCSQEADEHQRLACFDALAGELPKIKADQFGMTADIARKRDPDAPSRKADSIAAAIQSLVEVESGRWLFTLDNGQIWIQADARPGMRFAVGEAVRIDNGAMSSIWLTAEHHRKARVKRVK